MRNEYWWVQEFQTNFWQLGLSYFVFFGGDHEKQIAEPLFNRNIAICKIISATNVELSYFSD